mgnify:FL=1
MSRKTAKVAPLVLEPGRRTFCVSDVHGNLPLLKGLLEKLGFSEADTLIVMGDIVERNTGSLATLRYLMELSRGYDLRFILGNCDNLVLDFVDEGGELLDSFFERWIGNLGDRSVLVQMAREAGASIESRADYPLARRTFRERFSAELDFMRAMPHILLNDDYLLVHGGVSREDGLESLIAFDCMKNDHFWEQGHVFQRWVIAGHTPVTLYRGDIPDADPIIDEASHIISIDGGCTLKVDGQLNALLLPARPTCAAEFSFVSFDGFPTVTALEWQEGSECSVNIRWGRSALELLEGGEEFSRCRHVETGRELDILNSYLRFRPEGVTCEDSTDYRLPVEPGDTLGVVRTTGRGILCKKGGVTGWYYGAYQ